MARFEELEVWKKAIVLSGQLYRELSGLRDFGFRDHKYAPSALLLGFNAAGRALHFQVSFDDTVSTKIITIYEPDPNEWIEHRKRR